MEKTVVIIGSASGILTRNFETKSIAPLWDISKPQQISCIKYLFVY